MYNNIEKAIYFATKAHAGQKRRSEDIDVIFHPYSVGMMLKNIGMNDEIVCSGILHDIIEDTAYTYEDIANIFGKIIADYVLFVSEDSSIKDWRLRKEAFLDKLQNGSEEILNLELADKLHNLLSEYQRFRERLDIWENSITSYENNKWFYTEIYKLVKSKNINNELTDRYRKIINLYFGENYE